MVNYIKRYIDDEIQNLLECMGAIAIVEPKGYRKTSTTSQFANNIIELQYPTLGKSYIELSQINPLLLFEGQKPLLLDEWQLTPNRMLLDMVLIKVMM